MTIPRELTEPEMSTISALLRGKPETKHYIDELKALLAAPMDDGGMGSITLIPTGLETTNRSFGKQIVAGEFADSDGVLVSVAINVDSENRLYELDVWRVDFAPLREWPNPSEIKLVG